MGTAPIVLHPRAFRGTGNHTIGVGRPYGETPGSRIGAGPLALGAWLRHSPPLRKEPNESQDEHRSPRRQMERDPSQGGHLRVARLRRRLARDRRRRRPAAADRRRIRVGRVRPGRGRARRGEADRQQRERPRPEQGRKRRRSRLPGRDRRRHPQRRRGAGGERGQLARLRRRPGVRRRALGPGRIPAPQRRRSGGRKGRRQPCRRRRRPAPSPGHADRGDGRRQRQQGPGSRLQRRPQQGGDDLAAGHADHPRARLRRPGRGPGAAAAGVLGGARDDRACWHCRARSCRWTPMSPPSSSSSGWRSASTTRCSTCGASAPSAGPGARRRRPWRPRRRPRGGPSSSPG